MNTMDKARHDKMVSLVERMLELYKSSPCTPKDKERVMRVGYLVLVPFRFPISAQIGKGEVDHGR